MSDLPAWGQRARRLCRQLFTPVLVVALACSLLESVGVDVYAALDHVGLTVVATAVVTVALAGWAITGLTWLAAEAMTGYRRPR